MGYDLRRCNFKSQFFPADLDILLPGTSPTRSNSICCQMLMPKIFNRIFNVKWHWFTGFVPFFEQKNSRTFKGTFPIVQGLHSVRKTALSLCLFYFFHNMSNLSQMSFCVCSFLFGVLLKLLKVSIEIQALSRTNCNFQGLLRPWIFNLKFKDFQGACKTWVYMYYWN